MDQPQVLLRRTVLVLVAISAAIAENRKEFFMVGGSIKLSLDPPATQQITRIVWKHGANLLAEWTDGEFSFYDRFEGRTVLNKTTASLEITKAESADSGRFEVEVNNKVQDVTYDVKVIQKVSKPEVWVKPVNCGPTSKTCTLVCEGGTAEAQPITYSWKFDNQMWQQGDRELVVTNDTASLKIVSCLMVNQVSREVSVPIKNPLSTYNKFSDPKPPVGGWVALGVVLVVLLCLGVVGYWKREWLKRRFAQLTGNRAAENGGTSPIHVEGEPLREAGSPAGDRTTTPPP